MAELGSLFKVIVWVRFGFSEGTLGANWEDDILFELCSSNFGGFPIGWDNEPGLVD
jgi:hypothetical protein